MTAEEREPTRDELLAMAYVDGELAEEARSELESRLATEPLLLREVAQLKRLAVVARRVAPREPMDYEWERLEREVVHRQGHRLGFLAALLGAVGVSGWLSFELFRSELGALPKVLAGLLLGGLLLIFLLTLRARLRTLPYDPYTEVKR